MTRSGFGQGKVEVKEEEKKERPVFGFKGPRKDGEEGAGAGGFLNRSAMGT